MGSINFESGGYVTGNIDGQQGWSKTGPYDVSVVDNDTLGFGQALRISNGVTSGSFAGQAFSPGLTDPAGETARKHFETSFNIGTTSRLTMQPELRSISVSPDNGQGARMSYLRFEDQADGVHVFFDGTTATGDFTEKDIATLNRASAHSVRFLINFRNGRRRRQGLHRRQEADQRHDLGNYYPTRSRARCHRSARCCSPRAALQFPPHWVTAS